MYPVYWLCACACVSAHSHSHVDTCTCEHAHPRATHIDTHTARTLMMHTDQHVHARAHAPAAQHVRTHSPPPTPRTVRWCKGGHPCKSPRVRSCDRHGDGAVRGSCVCRYCLPAEVCTKPLPAPVFQPWWQIEGYQQVGYLACSQSTSKLNVPGSRLVVGALLLLPW